MNANAREQLVLKGITKRYLRDKRPFTVLEDVSLTVHAGEFVTLIGPSGSGKSTLFRLIGGIERPDAGQVYIGGRDVTGQPGFISYMPQQASLFPWMKVGRNIVSALEIAGIPRKEAHDMAVEWLNRIGLAEVANEYPGVLSGGMQQRVSFLRALLMPRDVMCLDEPFAALDALTRTDMQRWLLELWETQRRSVLFVTHSIEEALMLSDRIYVLTAAPARIVQQLVVPFPRPRRPDVWMEPAFMTMKRELLALLARGEEHGG
jgi:ABC-type nitrate/sulfonate/bicarbonate transport system ATPase subunit